MNNGDRLWSSSQLASLTGLGTGISLVTVAGRPSCKLSAGTWLVVDWPTCLVG